MRKYLLMFIYLLSSVLSFAQSYEENKKEFILANLLPGMKLQEVNKLYGEPKRKEIDQTELSGKRVYWHYSDFSIHFYSGNAYLIKLTTKKYTTFRGIKVGDDVNSILTKYNSSVTKFDYMPDNNKETITHSYMFEEVIEDNKVKCGFCTYLLLFKYKGNIVIEISVVKECCPIS